MLTLNFGRILGIWIISLVLPLSAQTPQATLSTNSVYLGLLPLGGFASEDITLSNTGTASLIVSSISMTGSTGAIVETNTCGGSLDPGASCVITFSFTPVVPGLEQAYLSIVDNDPTQVQRVLAGGVGQGLPQSAVLDLVNVPIAFADQPVFTHSPAYTITVVNRTASEQALPTSYYDFQTRKNAYHSGTPSDFPIINNCPQVVPSHGTCTLVVQFAPLEPGLRHAATPEQNGVFAGMATSPFPLVIMNVLSGKVLDMTGASAQNGSLLQQWTWNGAAQQTWDIASAAYVNFPLTGGTIVNHLSGKALDDLNASQTNGTPIQQWTANGSVQQNWSLSTPLWSMAFFDWHPGTFTIANRMSGKYLDVTNASTADGTLIQQWESDAPAFRGPYDQQLWQLLPSVGGMIISRLTGKALDVTNASTANGALLQEWTISGDPQQRWAIVPLGNGYYKILNTFTHKALDVTDASTSDGALIQQWDDNGSLQQQWDIIQSNSYYLIVNRLSGKLLDVTNASASNGTSIQQWSSNGGSQQQWYFAP